MGLLSWQMAKDHLAIASVTGFVALANYQLHQINKSLGDLAEKTAIASTAIANNKQRLDSHRDAILVLQASDKQQYMDIGVLQALSSERRGVRK